MEYEYIKKAKEYSLTIIKKIKTDLENVFDSQKFCIVTNGSFARNEASSESDLDFFIITDSNDLDSKYFTKSESGIKILDYVRRKINKVNSNYINKETGDTGTFGTDAVVDINDLIINIGGNEDSNIKFTRRMLFLLEGISLFNDNVFKEYRKKLIEKYIKDTVSDHQISRFFLNDIIRFYRTMATDFEYKIEEQNKKWGVRNIKLTYSRKLLYFSGVITVAETAYKTREVKVKETLKMLEMTPLSRLEYVSNSIENKALEYYDKFLEKISDNSIREKLEVATPGKKDDYIPEFRDLKNESKHFSWALSSILKQAYDNTHPIHHALIF